MKPRLSKTITFLVALVLLSSMFLVRVSPVHATSSSCVPAGGTGLTAKMIVGARSQDQQGHTNDAQGDNGNHDDGNSGRTVSGVTVDASGCDIGIFVAPGSNGVTLKGLTVTGANDHGILVQDASHVTIKNSIIIGNGVAPHTCPTPLSPPPCIHENKAVQLVGTSDSVIANNVVKGNSADGGIGVADDGPISVGGDPAALKASATVAFPSENDRVIDNQVIDNSNGCGIIVASYDANVGVENIVVRHNTIIGVAPGGGPFGGPGSFDGQIVVAGDGPFAVVSGVQLVSNIINGSLLPGIVFHANVFGDKIVDTFIRGNTISNNGWYPPFFVPPGDTNAPLSPNTTGMSLVAEVGIFPPSLGPAPVISHTIVNSNTIINDHTGVWLCGTSQTSIDDLDGNSAVPTAVCRAGGS